MIVDEIGEVHKSSLLQMFLKIGVLRNFKIFAEKHLCWSPFLIKILACNFIEKTLQHRCFPKNIAKFVRTAFFIEHLRWLLLVTAISRRYSEKQLLQNSKDNMLHNSVSVDKKVCPATKTEIHPGCFQWNF